MVRVTSLICIGLSILCLALSACSMASNSKNVKRNHSLEESEVIINGLRVMKRCECAEEIEQLKTMPQLSPDPNKPPEKPKKDKSKYDI